MSMHSKRNVMSVLHSKRPSVPVALNSNDVAYPLLQHLLHRPFKRMARNIRDDGISRHDELRMVATTMVSEIKGSRWRKNGLFNK